LQGWRREMFGVDAIAMLRGTLVVKVSAGEVSCVIE